MSRSVALIYPHQLYEVNPILSEVDEAWLVEEPLLFSQYRFHRQKLILHRASMKEYEDLLVRKGIRTRYVENHELEDRGSIAGLLASATAATVRVLDPTDDWLLRRLRKATRRSGAHLTVSPDPHFLTPDDRAARWLDGRKRFFFADFYAQQRRSLGILMDSDGEPVSGKWSFDTENRKRLPESMLLPLPAFLPASDYREEAARYVSQQFPNALGLLEAKPLWPTNHGEARERLADFLDNRLHDFGAYEDAISAGQSLLFHSALTPALNIGLLTPRQVVEEALGRADSVPLNSLEGFVRQVIGWREYVRVIYRHRGGKQRAQNALNHHQVVPQALYEGSTGMPPVDVVVKRVLASGYCHHIERLMVLGSFMALTEIHPDEVYRWFMEMFVDAYDWVMVPNVYGMSQYADGGSMTTKPYVSGSNYILKMSDFKKGEWCDVWDGLYWRFVSRHRDHLSRNPRTALAVKAMEKLEKLPRLLRTAEVYLEGLHAPR